MEVGGRPGAVSEQVASELAAFDRTVADRLEELDQAIRRAHLDDDLTANTIHAVLILCTWVHGEWIRIQPFPNGNGRTARILVNVVALRYGLPAVLRMRPRPGAAYAWVARQAMEGDWAAGLPLFVKLYTTAL